MTRDVPAGGKRLILGLGNDLLSDDGFGPAVASTCKAMLAGRSDIDVASASVAGFHLLDLLSGYGSALIIDVVKTGKHEPGTVMEWPIARASDGRTLGGSHQADLAETLALGEQIGVLLPGSITLIVVEALDLETVRERMTPAVAAAVPVAVERVRDWLAADVDAGDHP